jgi:tRNA (adenine37-N6)-methyltransferase
MAAQAALVALTAAFEERLTRERTARLRAEAALVTAASAKAASDGYPAFSIGTLHSPFSSDHGRQRENSSAPVLRGAPRQGALAPDTRASLVFRTEVHPDALDGLKEYSHIFVFFLFSEDQKIARSAVPPTLAECPWVNAGRTFFAKVSPPGLEGQRTGVFATRSPHRPNAIGVSLCTLRGVDAAARTLHLSGVDFLDGTPVIDVKPACEYDCGTCASGLAVAATVSTAHSPQSFPAWVERPLDNPPPIRVVWNPEALAAARACVKSGGARFYGIGEAEVCLRAVSQVLGLDPRSVLHGRGASAPRHTTALESARLAAASAVDGPGAATASEPACTDAGSLTVAGSGPYELRYDSLLLRVSFIADSDQQRPGGALTSEVSAPASNSLCIVEHCEEMQAGR